jgi:hypothetical protein
MRALDPHHPYSTPVPLGECYVITSQWRGAWEEIPRS